MNMANLITIQVNIEDKKQYSSESLVGKNHNAIRNFNGQSKYPKGTSLLEISKDYQEYFSTPIVLAKIGNELKELHNTLEDDAQVTFLDLNHIDGMRVYKRSLCFILVKVAKRVLEGCKIKIEHSIGDGLYCEIECKSKATPEIVSKIEKLMHEMIQKDEPFIRKTVPKQEALELFKQQGQYDKVEVFHYKDTDTVNLYQCGRFTDYFYGYMVPSTGVLQQFQLIYKEPGFILQFPNLSQPHKVAPHRELPQLHAVFTETKQWMKILGVENVGALNRIVDQGNIEEAIRVSEALHEKRFAAIADKILDRKKDIRVVLIAGPSSSGKTTSAQRLGIQLQVNGFRPVSISLDDYFVDREHTPKDQEGNLDFEALEAIDVKLFNAHLKQLLQGDEVEIPSFNFKTGQRKPTGNKLRLERNDILIIEGIHGLNEKLTEQIPKRNKFKIYVSALTSLNVDDHNRISTTDARLIRRIVRDYQFRGNDARRTIQLWPSVRRGEERNIFPFQEEADVMFNSSLLYELGVLKTFAQPLLQQITKDMPEYCEANRLLKFLNYFLSIQVKGIPENSIIREFTGDSCFY